jgi:hypothetical protein
MENPLVFIIGVLAVMGIIGLIGIFIEPLLRDKEQGTAKN